MNTTYKDINKDGCEAREHERTGTHAAFGRSYCYITCPFCQAEVRAFIWSLSGGGKRCPCGALHTSMGTTFKLTGAR